MATDLNTKASKRKLQELASLAYTRELAAELSKLEAKFARWRSGEIDPFELSDEIHRFHNGIARELYNLYGSLPPNQSVPRALARKALQKADVPSEILAALESTLQFFCEYSAEPAEPSGLFQHLPLIPEAREPEGASREAEGRTKKRGAAPSPSYPQATFQRAKAGNEREGPRSRSALREIRSAEPREGWAKPEDPRAITDFQRALVGAPKGWHLATERYFAGMRAQALARAEVLPSVTSHARRRCESPPTSRRAFPAGPYIGTRR